MTRPRLVVLVICATAAALFATGHRTLAGYAAVANALALLAMGLMAVRAQTGSHFALFINWFGAVFGMRPAGPAVARASQHQQRMPVRSRLLWARRAAVACVIVLGPLSMLSGSLVVVRATILIGGATALIIFIVMSRVRCPRCGNRVLVRPSGAGDGLFIPKRCRYCEYPFT